jgi:hypothetical protein
MKTKGWAIGTAALAVVLLVVGLVLQNQSNFSNHYVKSQLASHGIVFTPVSQLLPAQKQKACLVANAGKLMTTGTQAECYAQYQIGIDMLQIDHGKSYFQGHFNGYQQDQKMYAALKADPQVKLASTRQAVQTAQQADAISNALLAGEATKGLLLTAYGFSILGVRAGQAALACFLGAGALGLAAIVLALLSRRRRRDATPTIDLGTAAVEETVHRTEPDALVR